MVGWSRRMGGGAFIDEWTEGGKPLSKVCISHPSGIRVFLMRGDSFSKLLAIAQLRCKGLSSSSHC